MKTNIEIVEEAQRGFMEADLKARASVARAEAIQYAMQWATRVYIAQVTAPLLALAAELSGQY